MVKRTHRYPKKRRSPSRHRVKTHMRRGLPVKGFERGSGIKIQKSKVVGRLMGDPKEDSTPMGLHAYTINFSYEDGTGESVIVFSDNYQSASDEGWEERVDTRTPISVEVIDPDIGAALKWFGERVKAGYEYGKPRIVKATKLGAKYAVRGGIKGLEAGVAATRETYKLAAFGVQQKLVEQLLRLCYQKDKSKRIASRAALKKRYPSIYSQCDFSRPTRQIPKRVPEVFHLPRGYRG